MGIGFVDVDALESDVEAGTGEEGVELFLRFSIAASMLSRSAMSGWEVTGLVRDLIYAKDSSPMHVEIRSQSSRKR